MHFSTALLALTALSGCHLIDDFGRFYQAPDAGPDSLAGNGDGAVQTAVDPAGAAGSDAGQPPVADAATGADRPPSAVPVVDGGRAVDPPLPGAPDAGPSEPGTTPGCPERGPPRTLRASAPRAS